MDISKDSKKKYMNNETIDFIVSNKKTIISVLLTSTLLLVRDVVGIDINQYLLFVLMSLIFISLKKKEAILYLAFTCGVITGVNGYILLIGIFSVLLKDSTYLRHNKSFIYLSIFVLIWECLNSFSYYPLTQVNQILLYFGYLLTFFYYLMMNRDKEGTKQVILFYSIGLSVTLLIICIGVLQNPLDLVFHGEGEVRAAMGFSGDSNSTHFVANANNLAYFSIVLIALLVSLKKQVFSSNIIFLTLLIIAILAGTLSRSRTWIMLTSVLILVEFISRKGTAKIKFLGSVAALALIAFYFFSDFINSAIDGFMVRLELGNMSTAGNRTVLMKEYFDYMSNHIDYMFSGTGAIYYKEITRCSNSCHNAFQQVYIAYGVLGCLFFSSTIIKSIAKHNRSSNILNYLPFIVALFFIQSIQSLNPFHLMIPLAVSSLAYKINNSTNL